MLTGEVNRDASEDTAATRPISACQRPSLDNPGMSRTDRPPPQSDFAVVGGGILGLATGLELTKRHPGASVCLLEAENLLAGHQTSHSSGVIHRGVYYKPGSVRASLCVEGAASLIAYCKSKSIPIGVTGKLIVATSEVELERLDDLERRGLANGVPGLTRVGPAGISSIEPGATGLAALHSPETAVVDFTRVAESFAADFESAGGTIHLGAAVTDVNIVAGGSRNGAGGVELVSKAGSVRSRKAIFCAGLQSDRLAALTGGSNEPRILPIRGGYLKVKSGREDLVRGNVYPVPDPELPFLGAHLTRTVDGSLLIGPTAMLVGARDAYRLSKVRSGDLAETLAWPGTWRLIAGNLGASAKELRNSIRPRSLVNEAKRLVPSLRREDVEPGPSGIRAQAVGRDGKLIEDFLIEKTERAIHVRNAPSPAATSSIALASMICDQMDRGVSST